MSGVNNPGVPVPLITELATGYVTQAQQLKAAKIKANLAREIAAKIAEAEVINVDNLKNRNLLLGLVDKKVEEVMIETDVKKAEDAAIRAEKAAKFAEDLLLKEIESYQKIIRELQRLKRRQNIQGGSRKRSKNTSVKKRTFKRTTVKY